MTRSLRCARDSLVVRRGQGEPGVAFSVGRELGPATVRNRLRRRLREAVRVRVGGDRIGGTYLVIARPGAENLSFDELGSTLSECVSELEQRAR